MYTFKEAIKRIEAAGGKVTYEQLRHWENRGLLQVVKGKSTGGRPPKMLAEESLRAALALSNWYSVVRNPEAAKILLWLEGFDYLDVDPAAIVQRLRSELYKDLKHKIPSLPPFEEIDPEYPIMDQVLLEIDENFTRRGLADLGGLLPLVLGMIPNPEDFEIEQKYSSLFESEFEDPLPSALDMLLATQIKTLKKIPEVRDYLRDGTVGNPVAIRELGMAMVRGKLEEVDWEFVRALWTLFSLAADAAYELWDTGQVTEDQEAIKILIHSYRNIYTEEKNWPGGVLLMLVPPSLEAAPIGWKLFALGNSRSD